MRTNLKTLAAVIGAAVTLAGCANGNLETIGADQSPVSLNYTVTGLSFALGGYGTTVPLTKDLSLTAAHVAKVNWDEVVAYHPDCDLAIVKHDNTGVKLPELGVVHEGGELFTYGQQGLGSLKEGKGKYVYDVYFPAPKVEKKDFMMGERNRIPQSKGFGYFTTCHASVTTAAVREGMSGGAVVNAKGELVGIISSQVSGLSVNGVPYPYETASAFTALNGQVLEWVNSQVSTYEVMHTASN